VINNKSQGSVATLQGGGILKLLIITNYSWVSVEKSSKSVNIWPKFWARFHSLVHKCSVLLRDEELALEMAESQSCNNSRTLWQHINVDSGNGN